VSPELTKVGPGVSLSDIPFSAFHDG